MVIIYYSKRMQIKISQGTKLIGQSPGKSPPWSFHHPLPVGSGTAFLSWHRCMNTQGVLPTREASPTWSPEQFLRLRRVEMLISHTADLRLQPLLKLNKYHGTQSPHPESYRLSAVASLQSK